MLGQMNERRRILLRTVPFLVIGLVIFIVYLALFVDIPEMVGIMQRANLSVYALAALILILDTFLFTLTWQFLLLPLSVRVPLRKTFAYVWIGLFADLLIPAESVSGEVARAYLMSKEPNVDPGKVVASLVSQRMLGTFTTIATLFIGFLALLTMDYAVSGLMLQILLSITFVSVVALAFLLVICVKERWTERLVSAFMRFAERISRGRFKVAHYQSKIVAGLRAFYKSLRTFGANPSTLIPSIVFYVLTWLSSVALIFCVFVAIGYTAPTVTVLLLKVFIVYALMVAIKSIPLGVPAEVGLPDIVMTTLFILFAIPPDISAAATVLTRVLTVWFRFFIGFAVLQWIGVKSLVESGVFGRAKTTL
jgi:uncharacterized protein (TIRG00374 family)